MGGNTNAVLSNFFIFALQCRFQFYIWSLGSINWEYYKLAKFAENSRPDLGKSTYNHQQT